MTSQFNDGVGTSVKRTRRILLFVWIAVFAVFAVVIGNNIGKSYMEQKDREVAYQVAMQEVQETVTEYLVNNYAGVTKVEWQGVGVEFLASDVLGHSMYPNYVDSEVHVYVNDTDYLMIDYTLEGEADFDKDSGRYVLYDRLTAKNLDVGVTSGLRGAKERRDLQEQRAFDGFVKSPGGSPDAEIFYNVDIFKFDW